MKASYLLLSAFFASQATLACEPDIPNTSKIRGSKTVFLGTATSFNFTPTSLVSSVLVQPLQVLKGGPLPSAITISGCIPPLSEKQRMIVAVRGNQPYVYSAADYEAKFRQVIIEPR